MISGKRILIVGGGIGGMAAEFSPDEIVTASRVLAALSRDVRRRAAR